MEAKSENMIDRRTGVATNPRPVERMASGAKFIFEISLRVFEGDEQRRFQQDGREVSLLEVVQEGLRLIENDSLGAGGSRGYGKVKFTYTIIDPA
jgi:CRISPR-associated protein Csm3